MSMILKGKRPPLEPSPPRPLKTLIAQCWQQRPRDRPDIDDVFDIFESEV